VPGPGALLPQPPTGPGLTWAAPARPGFGVAGNFITRGVRRPPFGGAQAVPKPSGLGFRCKNPEISPFLPLKMWGRNKTQELDRLTQYSVSGTCAGNLPRTQAVSSTTAEIGGKRGPSNFGHLVFGARRLTCPSFLDIDATVRCLAPSTE